MTYFDYIILIILVASSFIGFYRGFIKEFISLLSYLISFLAADLLGPVLSPFLDDYIESTMLKDFFSYIMVFLSSLLFCSLFIILFSSIFSKIGVSNIDRILGSIFGLLRGFFLVLLIVVLCYFTNLSQEEWLMNSVFMEYINLLIDNIKLYLPNFSSLKELLP